MNPDILQAIATGLVTILGFFMFYDSKKRTEAAKASQEEAKATAQYASGWKDLCERKDSELKTKDEKIDSLYDALNQHRASEDNLKHENMELRLQLQEASWNRSTPMRATNTPRRIPPSLRRSTSTSSTRSRRPRSTSQTLPMPR